MTPASSLPPELVYTPEGQPLRREDIRSQADQMRYDLGRYRAWRCHHDADFKARFDTVQKWQAERLQRTHADLLVDPRYTAVTQFFLTDLYGGLDLTELAREVERALPIATRLLPESVMRTSALALELNALTGELDEAVTTMLFETMGESRISDKAMIEAYRACDNQAERHHQMQMLADLGGGLDRYVRSRVIYATFKIASRPAQMAGLSGLYSFLGRGFEVMRPMGSAQDFLTRFVGKEVAIVDNIFAGKSDPFTV